jgi:hypothetical protein
MDWSTELIAWLQRYDGAIAVFAAVFLVSLAVILAAEAYRRARRKKDSVQILRRVLAEVEAPILQVIPPSPVGDDALGADTGTDAHYSIENCGRTPANLYEISLQFAAATELPASPDYIDKKSIVTVLRPGARIRLARHEAPAGSSVGYGYLKYTDASGSRHITGFGLRPSDGAWVETGGPAYNYRRVQHAEQ